MREIKFRAWDREKKKIYIPDYIKANAKTRAVPKLVKQFEELQHDDRFYFSRTSEIFHKYTGELRRMPKIRGYLVAFIHIV